MKYPIYLVTFPSQYLAAATFMRIQECYESPSPRFRGGTFTCEEFMDWYAQEHGEFSYFDWSGFNVPSWALQPFFSGDFDPLQRKERVLLDLVRDVPAPYYLIGAVEGDIENIRHEVVHGLFTMVPEYREAVLACLRAQEGPALRRMRERLTAMGYDASVIDDEANAYLVTGLEDELKDWRLRRPARALAAVFDRHFGFDIRLIVGNVMSLVHHLRFTPPSG